MARSVTHCTTVRFADVDAANVVYFSRVYEMAHAAYEELMAASGLPIRAVFERREWGMPLVHTEAQYSRPWRLGDRVTIRASIHEVTERSVAFAYAFVDDAGVERTAVSMRHVFVSLKSFESCSVPPEFTEAMQRLGLLE
jgi:4-hydroxybenzoyl-CoA thioesterase